MELLGNNPSMQDLIEKLNEVVGSLNDSLPNTDSEIAEVKKLVSFGSDILAGRLNAKLWYFKTQEFMKASTELCEGDSCFILNPGGNTGEGTFEYWYIYKTADVGEILDSYIELANPDLVGVKIQELTFKALLSKFDSIKKFSFLDLVTTATETNPGKALDAIVGKLLADRIGNLGELSTVDKNSLVGAIKEVKTVVEDNYSENTKKINSKAERTELQTETSERKQEIAVERARINNLLKSTSDTVTSTCEVSDEYGGNASAEVSSDGINVQIQLTNFQFLKTWESSDGTEATASPEKILDLPNHSFAPFEERTVVHTDGTLSYYIENDSLYVTSSTATISIFGDVTISYTIIDSLQSEVADIRVGANGKVYDTAGEAVRGQVSELKEDLVGLTGDVIVKNSDFILGGYLNASGTFKSQSTSSYTDFISVKPNQMYSIGTAEIGSINFTICEYDSDKTFLRRRIIYATSVTLKPTPFSFESDVSYIRCSGQFLSDTSHIRIIKGEYDSDIVGSIFVDYGKVPELSDYKREVSKGYVGTVSRNGIYTTITNNNATYEIRHIVDNSINVDCHRVYGCKFTENNEVIWTNSDADGVVKLIGEDDFIGGFHGDEITTKMEMYIDGVKVYDGDFSERKYKEINIYCESNCYHCNTSNQADTLAFKRYKIITFNEDGFRIQNRWVVQDNVSVYSAFFGMLSVNKMYADTITKLINSYHTDNEMKLLGASDETGRVLQNVNECIMHTPICNISMRYNGMKQNYNKGYVANYESQGRLKCYMGVVENNENGVAYSVGDELYGDYIIKI